MIIRASIDVVLDRLPLSKSEVGLTASELVAAIDQIAALPELDPDRDGICGDKGWIEIHGDKDTLLIYFPGRDVVRFEYSVPPANSDDNGVDGHISSADAKIAIQMIADDQRPKRFLIEHSIVPDFTRVEEL